MSRKSEAVAAVLGIGAIVLILGGVFAKPYFREKQFRDNIEEGRAFHMAAQQAALDYSIAGDGVGYPADVGTVTIHQYLEKLIAKGYLPKSFGKTLHERFLVGNASEKDPEGTILLINKPGKISGDIVFVLKPDTAARTPPPHVPAYLPD